MTKTKKIREKGKKTKGQKKKEERRGIEKVEKESGKFIGKVRIKQRK